MTNETPTLQLLELVSYFRKTKAFQQGMECIRDKWRSYGRAAGVVRMTKTSPEEREAWGAFLGTYFEKEIRFTLPQFEKVLAGSRFSGITLEVLLEGYFGSRVESRKAEREKRENRKEERRNRFCARALETILERKTDDETGTKGQTETEDAAGSKTTIEVQQQPPALRFLDSLSDQELDRLLEKGEGENLLAVLRALQFLEQRKEGEMIRLAVLGMNCAGNPHAFDRGRSGGYLLVKGLLYKKERGDEDPSFSHSQGEASSLSAEQIWELYEENGILADEISSFTVLYGINLYEGEREHPACRACYERGEPFLASLANLSRITSAKPKQGTVYVVENQMVFSELKGRCPEASLICSSGQMKTASLKVLDLLCREDCEIYYSGDLDPEGIGIADRVVRRSGGRIQLWHMSPEDYENSLSEMEVAKARVKKMERLATPELIEVSEKIREKGKAGYQEALLDQMTRDMQERIGCQRRQKKPTKEGRI